MLKAIIIDDEPDNLKLLALQLKKYCQEVEVIQSYSRSEEGLAGILQLKPDIVFLDIEMPVMNGFELLEAVGQINFHIVFVTAYDQFAVKAFRFSALDYLLKPIDANELKMAVAKAGRTDIRDNGQLKYLKSQLHAGADYLPDKIALPYQNGVTFIELCNILYCEARDNYTIFYLKEGKQYTAAKTLRIVQEMLEERNFLRVHRQYLVNLEQINKYVKGDTAHLVMNDQKKIPVSRSQKEKLENKFGWL